MSKRKTLRNLSMTCITFINYKLDNNINDKNCILLSTLINTSYNLIYLNLEGNNITEKGCSIILDNVKNYIPIEIINFKSIILYIYYTK